MRDDELDELLAVADRQFQRALITVPAEYWASGLAAIIGHERAESRERRSDFAQEAIESLVDRINEVVDLLMVTTRMDDAVDLLFELSDGLVCQTLSRERALALVGEATVRAEEVLGRAFRADVLDLLDTIATEVRRLFGDVNDHVGRCS